MRILALTKYDVQAASTRQRFAQFVPFLRQAGCEVELSPMLPNSYINAMNEGRPRGSANLLLNYFQRLKVLRRGPKHDLLWVQYELFPYLPGFFEKLAAGRKRPIVCDFDDAIFHTYDENPRWLVRKLLGRKLEPLLSSSAIAVCGNEYLRSYAAQFCRSTAIVPTVVDTAVYAPAALREDCVRPLVVGWMGSPSTWVNVVPLLPVILPLLKAHGAVFRAVGAGRDAEGIEGVEVIPWSEDEEVAHLQAMDVGIMPLLDEPFQRGKCGYKLIQYMACGLPVIAAPVGVNSQIVTNGQNGLIARTPAEWAEALTTLLLNAPLRREMGVRGRRLVEDDFSLKSQQYRLLEIFRTVAKSEPNART